MKTHQLIASVACALTLALAVSSANAQQRPPYGQAVNLETAKKIGAAATAEAKKNSWNVAIAIVDNHGFLVYYEMMDDTQTASANVAIEKARTSAMYRRASKEFEENIAGGRVAVLGLPGVHADRRRPAHRGRRQDDRRGRRQRRDVGAGRHGRQGGAGGAGEVATGRCAPSFAGQARTRRTRGSSRTGP